MNRRLHMREGSRRLFQPLERDRLYHQEIEPKGTITRKIRDGFDNGLDYNTAVLGRGCKAPQWPLLGVANCFGGTGSVLPLAGIVDGGE